MAVFRIERNKNYTVMSNYHLRDKSISLKVKGLLSQMLSLPEECDYTLTGLTCINKESKNAVRTAISELEQAGYIRRHPKRNERGGFAANEYVVYELLIQERPEDTEQIDELVELMAETVCSKCRTLRIAGDTYSAEVVRSCFLSRRPKETGRIRRSG